MSFVQDEHVVQALATDAPDESLDVGVLPRTSRGDEHFFDAHVSHPPPTGGAIDAVSIAQEIPRGLAPGKGLDDLLGRPWRSGVFCDVKTHDAAPFMHQDHEDKEYFVRHGLEATKVRKVSQRRIGLS